MADAFALFDQGLRISGRWKQGANSLVAGNSPDSLRQAGVILDEDPGLAQLIVFF